MPEPTPGWEPYETLWNIFHERQPGREGLSGVGEAADARILIHSICHDPSLLNDKRSLGDVFEERMPGRRNAPAQLPQVVKALVQGLLECVDPNNQYDFPPYTDPEADLVGIYDHFKGGVYLVTGFGSWASGNGERVVEYISMIFGTKHYRLATQWGEVVQWPDGKYRSRFVYRGPSMRSHEPPFKVPSPPLRPV